MRLLAGTRSCGFLCLLLSWAALETKSTQVTCPGGLRLTLTWALLIG